MAHFSPRHTHERGFTLIESMIGIGIFVLLAGAVYQTFFVISRQIIVNRESTTISNLASQYLEIARNVPYAQIGTTQGNPHGTLPDEANAIQATVGGKTYNIYYEVTYVDDPADGTALNGTDPAPNDYKQVKVSVKTTTNAVTKFVTNIVPTGLESLASGGALSVSVIDAVGQPVPSASITITNTTLSPSINITRTSDASGKWIEVGLPDSSNSYHIVVTKNGYSSDQTYQVSGPNPSPIKSDATILDGQVTQISFAIDRTSSLTFNTLGQTCEPISSIGLGIKGAKLIGTPDVLKFNNSYTSDGNGKISLPTLEWDNYTPALISNSYMIYGSSPIQQINLLPNTTQLFNIILGPKTTHSLLVIVKDSLTTNPIEGATVHLTNNGSAYDETFITGGSLWNQEAWNGGSGQADWGNTSKYFEDDGGVSTTGIPLAVRLTNNGSGIVPNGTLTSSTFDTGSTNTTYTTLMWQPTSQDPSTTVKFQIATNNDNTTWDFVGPDGTPATYYTTPGTTIGSSNNNKQYVRYKVFLSTTDITKNPTLTSIGVNYISGCFTPGQVIFPNLTSGSNYDIDVSMPGYTSKSISNMTINGYNTIEVTLSPSN